MCVCVCVCVRACVRACVCVCDIDRLMLIYSSVMRNVHMRHLLVNFITKHVPY